MLANTSAEMPSVGLSRKPSVRPVREAVGITRSFPLPCQGVTGETETTDAPGNTGSGTDPDTGTIKAGQQLLGELGSLARGETHTQAAVTAEIMVAGTLLTYTDNFLAQRVLNAAKYSGAELTVTKDLVFRETNKTPEFLKKLPLGKVPAFEKSNGVLLTKSKTIACSAHHYTEPIGHSHMVKDTAYPALSPQPPVHCDLDQNDLAEYSISRAKALV